MLKYILTLTDKSELPLNSVLSARLDSEERNGSLFGQAVQKRGHALGLFG